MDATGEDIAALYRRGVDDYRAGRLGAAETACRALVAVAPARAPHHLLLARVLEDRGRRPEAAACLREALRLQPDYPEALERLGRLLCAQGHPDKAEPCFREALRLTPDFPEALHGLGMALQARGRPAQAEAACRAALRLRPDYPQAWIDLGNALAGQDRLAEAEASFRQALALRPGLPVALNNLGNLRLLAGDPDGAQAAYRDALRGAPDYAMAHRNLAMSLLLGGRLEEGWREYEWRWRVRGLPPGGRDFSAPLWNGEPLAGRTLLLHAEQGQGDTLQFCRFAAHAAPDATVILEVQPSLVRLLAGLAGVSDVVARDGPLPAFDVHCPLLSLPRLCGATLETIPAEVPYLAADPALAGAWRARLAGLAGLKVGLVWAGNPRRDLAGLAAVDVRRSIGLSALAPLASVAGACFVSLQKGDAAAEAADPPAGMILHHFTADLADFADTAALIENLDLVISVDTSVVHLAGAMGKPVWLLNRYDTCWRWLIGRDDSPWYPTLRQFRQPSLGDWASVVARVREALAQHVAARRPARRIRPPGAKRWSQTPRPGRPPAPRNGGGGATPPVPRPG